MRQAVDRFIKRHQLLKKGAVVVVGVSGGPDSMALLDYLESVRRMWGLTLIAASADHGLRGEDSAADVSYVESYCREKEIAFEGTALAVKEYQEKHGVSVEVAARECRYRFFEKVMKRCNADYLALAHHGDDQIETMLMRQVRGSIGRARSGIPVRRPFAGGEVIRPLLAVDKSQIEAYCRERGLNPRRDPSNDSDVYTRNRFRHHVLPFIKKENPNAHRRFQYESEMLSDEDEYLMHLARTALDGVTKSENSEEIRLSIQAFSAMPIALQRRMIHLILNYLYRQIPPSLSVIHIEEVLYLLKSEQPSARLDFPLGFEVVRSYDDLVFTYKEEDNKPCAYQHTLNVPGKVSVPAGVIIAEFAREYRKHPDDSDALVCDADLVRLPIMVRTRRPGDRLLLKGMKGSKKVKAIFIDRKIRRSLRDKWPLVTDAAGTVLWLPGLKHSGAALPSRETKRLIVLRFHPSGDVWEDIE
ncbi:MAG TPA: tRNA lysidine(34) synthetase TilS [Bacillales bacterium]|nr:tRNA lysidine(34) synthetase TilS [Bacillales bacterium]